MANHSFQVIAHGKSGLSEDDFVNVLYFDTDDVEGTADGIHTAFETFASTRISGVEGMTIKAYANAQGQPVFTKDYAYSHAGGAVNEVAVCLSYATTDDFSAAGGRQRGRIYLGPLTTGQLGDRPQESLRSAVLDLGEDLAQIGTASATTWMMHSRTLGTFSKIEVISVDDAWDTQRRRGLAPTLRTSRDVQ